MRLWSPLQPMRWAFAAMSNPIPNPTGLDAAIREGRGLDPQDYDGVAELWYDSEEALIAAGATEEGRKHGHILAEDEGNFIDFARSKLFFTEENIVIEQEG